MPELPEVETIRKELKKDIIGKKISKIDILFTKQFKGNSKQVIGAKISCLHRSGKLLSIELNNKKYLNFHLKLSGQIMYANNVNNAVYDYEIPLTSGAKKLPAKSTRVIIYFDDGSGLFFNESRKFGWIKVADNQQIQKGIDILSPKFTLDYFISKLKNTNRAIKLVLMDQDRFAGIGNIYANEILFDAKINPEVKSNKTIKQSNNLYLSVIKIINQGVKYSGSSGKDDNYILPDGSRGKYQYHFKVYQQDKKPCVICKTIIKRIKQGGRSSFYCPKCQKKRL